MAGRSPQSGQSLAEYALIVTLIVIVALVALTLFGSQINDILSMIANQINSYTGRGGALRHQNAGRRAGLLSTVVLYRWAAPLREIAATSFDV